MTPEEPQENPIADYQARMEEHEFVKQQGAEAWAKAVSEMLPDVDPDKKLMIREGLKAMMTGPPPFPAPTKFSPPKPEHIFEEHSEDGSITVWDWICLAIRGTHFTLHLNKDVSIMRGRECLITLTGVAAEAFWQWKTDFLKYAKNATGPVFIGGGY
jgi:hypothetical protein